MADILLGGYDCDGPALFNVDMFGSIEKKILCNDRKWFTCSIWCFRR